MADLIDRAALVAMIRTRASELADMAIEELPENARNREAMEAALTTLLPAIAALPAQGVRVRPLVWTAREDLKGLHEACGADGLYRNVWDQKNGTWVYEGDPTANPQRQARFPTLDAAKAAAQADYEARILAALAPAEAGGVDWRDDPSADERWNAGCDFAMTMLCQVVKADPDKVSWDAATETLDGDVMAVIGNILTEGLGEDWNDRTPAPDAVEALVKAARVLNRNWPYHMMEPAFDAMEAVEGEGVDTMFAAGIRALASIRAGGWQ